jgi:hypothetical protein
MFVSRFRRQQSAVGHTVLARLLRHTARHAKRVQLPELYKLGILLKDPNDILDLRGDRELMLGLSRRFQELRGEASPFQVSLLEAVLPGSLSTTPYDNTAVPDGSSETTAVAPSGVTRGTSTPVSASVTAHEFYKAIVDLVKEAEVEHGRATARDGSQRKKEHPDDDVDEDNCSRTHRCGGEGGQQHQRRASASAKAPSDVSQAAGSSGQSNVPSLSETLGSTRAEALESHLKSLEPLLRQLSPTETARLIRTLAKINYTNYGHTTLLTRRGCEVASHLPRHDLCTLFFNLHKLHTRDSCVPIVNGILAHVQELTAEEVYLLCQAIERQENNSTASQRLLTPLIGQAVKKLPDATSSAYHRTLLVSMARYHAQQPTVVNMILQDWVARWKATSSEKDVLVILEIAMSVAAPGTEPEGLNELVDRLTALAPTMDLRHLDRVMDVMSNVPMHMSTDIMRVLLTRLENESGKLTVGQLKFILQLLSTYPPAKGQVAVVSLAYACALRARSMDAETLESIVISLAMLQLFTDDFFSIALVLQKQKGGIRSFGQAQTLFECCTAEMAALPHGLGMLTSVICTLAPNLNDEELSYCRKALMKLGVTNKEVLQQIFTKAKRSQRAPASFSSSRKRRGGYYDPMEDLI